MNHSTRVWRAVMALALSLSACGDDTPADCDLAALIPDLANVQDQPRDHRIAETLALERSSGVAAEPGLYASLASDLDAIVAVDPRMRLEDDFERQLYGFHHPMAEPVVLGAYGEDVDAARPVLEPGCGRTVTAALGGVATLQERTMGDRIFVGFPARLHHEHLIAIYASLGIPLVSSGLNGDGSRAAFRDLEVGRESRRRPGEARLPAREFLFELRGGDCPSGCTFARTFWWRVTNGAPTLIAEWGADLEDPRGGTVDPPPEGFDRTGFNGPWP